MNFCNDDFWHPNQTWHTETPKLTKCLSNGFIIIPSLVFFILISLEFTFIFASTNKRINFNGYNVIRFLICSLAIFSSAAIFYDNVSAIITNNHSITISDLVSSICQLLVFILLTVIYHFHRVKGVITSALIFISTFLFSLCSFIILLDKLLYNETMYNDSERNNINRLFLFNICLFILSCFTDDPVDAGLKPAHLDNIETNKKERNIKGPVSPYQYSSFISRISFFWYTSLVRKSAEKEIELNEIYEVRDDLKIGPVIKRFNERFYDELEYIKKLNLSSPLKKNKYNIISTLKVIWKTEGANIMILVVLKTIGDLFVFCTPLLLNYMIEFMKDPNEPKWHLVLIIIGFVSSTCLSRIFIHLNNMNSFAIAINLKTCFSNLIFKKTLLLSPEARKKRTIGQIVNLFSTDSSIFQNFAPFFVYIWSSPLMLTIGYYILYGFVGNAIFFSVFMMALIMALQFFLNDFNYKYVTVETKINDERIKLINEVLAGIKVIKMYAYEKAFINRITKERNEQIKYIKKMKFIGVVLNWLFFSITPFFMLTSTFAIYIFFVQEDFTTEKAFVIILIFNILDHPVEIFPTLFAYLIRVKVSLKRISDFLAEEELEGYVKRKFNHNIALSIKNKARFAWTGDVGQNQTNEGIVVLNSDIDFNKTKEKSDSSEKTKFELKDIELEVEKGQFVAIVGLVGSGKSSLISAILGEMYLLENDSNDKGKVIISDDQDFCYVPQQAWIQNKSFKENILFSKPFNKEKYRNVISACALEADLKQFEGGDETEIGEKGINLSGGQKQRVSLARACYSSVMIGDNNQIILLDDVLSSVDAHVGKHLCENLLNSNTGILSGTTRILVTNQLNQLSDLDLDQILILKDGKIELKCTYDELMKMEMNGELEDFNLRLTQNQMEDDKESKKSIVSSQKSINEESKNEMDEKRKSCNKNLIEKEKREKGRVDFDNYLIFLKYYGYLNIVLVLTFIVAGNFFQVYSRVYLANWTGSKPNSSEKSFDKEHLLIFVGISSLESVFDIFMNFFMTLGILSTIKLFHEQLLYRILRSKMCFFDTTPLGRILNRFSSDIKAIDSELPSAIREGLVFLVKLISSILILLYKQPNSLVFYCIIFSIYYYIMNLYICSSRQMKRLDSTTRSPIYSHFSETITGSSSIRAYNKIDDFEEILKSRLDPHNRTFWYLFVIGNRWLNSTLDILTSLIILVITIQFILQRDSTTAGDVGLLLTYAFSLNFNLSFLVRFIGKFETNAISIERINEYCNNEEEDKWIKDVRPVENWPNKGEIEFVDYSTRYRKETNLVLKNLSFKVNETEKVGIVGRTGSGKSTSTLALLRLIEPVKGQIIIDDVDISQIGLHDLRSRISIIPQDAVLFTGTIRFNLDPFDKYSDDEVYRSLEHAHLKSFINTLKDGIYHEIIEDGQNISGGQKQLICLARALLLSKNCKILVLDEATASIDFATDELVQKTIRCEFKDCTTITIAHRLNTVLDSTRILVLDKGELKEYDEPDKLLNDKNSMFHSLAKSQNVI